MKQISTKQQDRRSSPREGGRDLNTDERARVERVGLEVKKIAEAIQNKSIEAYEEAERIQAIYEGEDWRLWLAEGVKPTLQAFCEFAVAHAGEKKAGTVQRSLSVVRSYTKAQYIEYVRAGVCPTALAYIAEVPDDIRAELLQRRPK